VSSTEAMEAELERTLDQYEADLMGALCEHFGIPAPEQRSEAMRKASLAWTEAPGANAYIGSPQNHWPGVPNRHGILQSIDHLGNGSKGRRCTE
jgi:hypothetical protein